MSKWLQTLVKFAITIWALYFVFTKISFHEVLKVYASSQWIFLIVALLLFVLSKAIAAFRLNRLFREVKAPMSQITHLKLYLLSMFYNLFLPGGIGGDGYKIYILNKQFKAGVKPLFGAVLIDRLAGLAALGILATLLFMIVPKVIPFQLGILVLVPIVLVGFYLLMHWFYPYFKKFYRYVISRGLMVQTVQTLCALFILWALGMHSNLWIYLFLFLLSSIVAVLPITVGGVGARELTFLYGSQLFHLDINIAVALSLMFYLITAFTSFWGIIWVVKPLSITSPDENGQTPV